MQTFAVPWPTALMGLHESMTFVVRGLVAMSNYGFHIMMTPVSCRTLMSTLSVPRALEYTGRALSIMFLLPECQVHGTGMPQVLQVIHHDNAPANTDGVYICDAASDLCEVKGLLHPGAALLSGAGMCCGYISATYTRQGLKIRSITDWCGKCSRHLRTLAQNQ